MADIFLSYKREDEARVRKLVSALRAAGLDSWWDQDIPPSAPWEATIEKELAAAKAVIVCWSPASVASENVRSEARVAREDGRLIQLFLKPCQPPLFFGERQGVDLAKWRGNADDQRIAKLVETARKVASGEQAEGEPKPKRRALPSLRIPIVAAILLVLAGSLAGWWLLSPAKASGPMTLAVLPFRAMNPADANLVDAIWDDTRGAISRNPNLRVIGREAVSSLADKDLGPADYRKRVGADYLLDGSVQHVGDQVRMKLSLTRTSDGAEVWSDEVGGKLDDVFAFQQRVATEVEGRIRGRVAPGGGAKAENIATSAEVYGIFAEARAHLQKRDSADAQIAIKLLKKAIALDPNYAPAWADLGQILGMAVSRTPETEVIQQQAEAVADLRRAIQLAPNLAHAHAALGMVQMSPEMEGEMRKGVQLDPNDADAWTWFANYLQSQSRLKEALAARNRAVEIEPLWYIAIGNKIGTLSAMKNYKGVDAEVARVAATGDPVLLLKIKANAAMATNRPADQVNALLRLRIEHPEESAFADDRLFVPLLALGFADEAMKAWHIPPEVAQDYRGVPDSPAVIKAAFPQPLEYWIDGDDAPALFGRMLPRHGRFREYIGYYDAAFKSPTEMFAAFDHYPGRFMQIAPTVAMNLRAADRSQDADAILQHSEQLMAPALRKAPPQPSDLALLSRTRAAEGQDDQAIALLRQAVAGGWIPDRSYAASDIADEPCFARLLGRPDFQGLRRQVVARVELERRKVDPALLARSGLSPKRTA